MMEPPPVGGFITCCIVCPSRPAISSEKKQAEISISLIQDCDLRTERLTNFLLVKILRMTHVTGNGKCYLEVEM